MKKVTMGLILSLLSISTFANYITPKGRCGNEVYFMRYNFQANSEFEFRIYNDTAVIKTMYTGSQINDSLFSLPSSDTGIIKVQFRHKVIGSNDNTYTGWSGNTLSGDQFVLSQNYKWAGCTTAPVSVSNVGVQKDGNQLKVSFGAANETDVKEYQILASYNQNDWYNIKTIAATGASNYAATISLTGSSAFILFGIALYNESKKKYSNKRKWVSFFLLAGMIILFSCTKAKDTGTIAPYKFIKVATISNSGAAPSYSETTSIP